MQCFFITFGQRTLNTITKYNEEPLHKHCFTDSGIQSKLIFTSEKTNHRQQLTHAANSERDLLASLLLPVNKSVWMQIRSFVDDASIDLWKCQMEIDKVKSKKTESEPIASHSTTQREPNISCSTNQIKCDESSTTFKFKLFVAFVPNNYTLSFDGKSSATLKLVVASVTNEDLKGSTNGSLARFEQLPVGVSVAPTFFNSKISSIFQLVVAFVPNKYKHNGVSQHPPHRKWTPLIRQERYQVSCGF